MNILATTLVDLEARAARRTRALTLAGAALACAPLLVTHWPPLADYLLSLGRVHVFHDLLTAGRFADRYQLTPVLVPNLGIDIAVLPLLWLGIDSGIAGRLFIAGVIVLTGFCVVALHRVLFRRASAVPLVAFAFTYNDMLMTGFLNSQLSLTLAIAAFAGWLRWRGGVRPWVAALLLAGAELVLFLCHLLGALALPGLVLGYAVAEPAVAWAGARWRGMRWDGPPAVAWRTTLACLATMLVVLVLLFVATPIAGHDSASHFLRELARVKRWQLRLLPHVLLGYDASVDLPVAALAGLGLLAAAARGCLRVAWPMLPVVAGLVLVLALAPEGWGGTWYVPERLPFIILLLGLASLDIAPRTGRGRAMLAMAIMLMVIARSASATLAWRDFDRLRRPIERALAQVPPESVVCRANLATDNIHGDERFPFKSMAPIALIRAGAFSPLFAAPAQNQVVPTPKYQAVIDRMPGTNRVDLYPAAPRADSDMASADVRAACDYIMVERPELYQRPVPAWLHVVAAVPGAGFYRIER